MKYLLSLLVLVGCGGPAATEEPEDVETCEIPCQYSTAASGGSCQVNLFCDDSEPAVYCLDEGDGSVTCDCGPAAESPPSFSSTDFCSLDMEEQVCEAIAQCGNWVLP